MQIFQVVPLSALSLHVLAAPNLVQNSLGTEADECASAHVFCLRGTNEPPGTTRCGIIGDMVKKLVGVEVQGIEYPAAAAVLGRRPSLIEYAKSEKAGYENLTIAMKEYYEKCPNTPTALLGYSQGAHVVGDVLCGRTSGGFTRLDPIKDQYTKQIKAVLQLGDPSSRARQNMPWPMMGNNTSGLPGFFPRAADGFAACNHLSDRWQTWCDASKTNKPDLFCGAENHAQQMLTWLAKQLGVKVKSDGDPNAYRDVISTLRPGNCPPCGQEAHKEDDENTEL